MKFTISIILFILSINTNADILKFDINNYTINSNGIIFKSDSLGSNVLTFKDILLPITTEIVPKKIENLEIISLKKTFLKKVSFFCPNKLNNLKNFGVIPTYNNKPFIVSINGKMGKTDVSVLQKVPFVFKNDSLFFINEISYLVNGSISRLAKKQIPIQDITKITNMLIITSEKFVDIFDKYSNFKNKLGISSKIFTTEYIYSNYSGIDDASKIRNFIKEQYTFNNIEYVLLGGAYNIIPVRKVITVTDHDLVPTDVYYSCLDGSYDNNMNGIFGEIIDSIDLFPEVLVGRFTGSNKIQLENIINKTINYFSNPLDNRPDFFSSTYLLGLNIFQEKDSETTCELIKDRLLSYYDFEFDSLYESTSVNNTKQDALQYFNKSYNIVYGATHGSETCIGTPDNWLIFNDEIYSTTSISGLYYLSSCYIADLTLPGFAHRAITAPFGGCVSYIGASKEDYPNVSRSMNSLFFSYFMNGENLGNSLKNAKYIACSPINKYGTNRNHFFTYNIFGDPSSKFFVTTPSIIKIDSIGTIVKGNNSLFIKLSEKPLKQITFSLLNNNELFSTVETDSQEFSIPYSFVIEDSISLSFISVLSPLQDTTLYILDNEKVCINSINLLDYNKNKIIENGENFQLEIMLNTFSSTSNLDTLKIFLDNSNNNITGIFDTVFIPLSSNININDTLFSLNYFSNSIGKDSTINLNLNFQLGSVIWQEKLNLFLSMPKLDLQYFQFDSITNKISPSFINTSLGNINKASIKLIEANSLTILDSVIFTDIIGEELLKIPNGLFIDSFSNFYFDITLNDSIIYSTDTFSLSSLTNNNIDIEISSYSTKIMLEWSGNFSDKDLFNIYIQYNDSLSKLIPINLNPINERFFEVTDTFSGNKFIRIATIDSNKYQSNLSKAIPTKTIPIYKKTPFIANTFSIYMSYFTNNKIVLSSRNSSISSLDFEGNNVYNNLPTIFSTQETFQENLYTLGSAVGDVNGDGKVDMVNFANTINDSVTVNIVDLNNGQLIATKNIYGYPFDNSPAIVYDNSTLPGTSKILLSLFNGNVSGYPKGSYISLYSYKNGEIVIDSGYPIISTKSSYNTHTPIISDLDSDGYMELIVDVGKFIQVYDAKTCTLINEFALESNIASAINVSDLNRDNSLEIIALTDNTNDTKSTLHILSYQNKTLSFFNAWDSGKALESNLYSFYANHSSPSCVDINGDSLPEIITITGKNLYVYSLNGNTFPGFPVALSSILTTNNISAPSFADFNGDGFLDILFLDHLSKVSCISGMNAKQLSGFPISIPFSFDRIFGSIPIADLDNDGDLEFGIGNKSGSIIVFDYFGNSSPRWVFDNYRGNSENSGELLNWTENFFSLAYKDSSEINQFNLFQAFPNPFNPQTKISFSVPTNTIKTKVSVKIFNLQGRMIKELANDFYNPGVHSITFNSMDRQNNKLASGIYFCKMEAGNYSKTLKLLLLK